MVDDLVEPALAVDDADRPLGFAELSLRTVADGCTTSPVAYLEGWYVVPDARRRGVGIRSELPLKRIWALVLLDDSYRNLRLYCPTCTTEYGCRRGGVEW